MLRPYEHRHHVILPAGGTARSRRGCVPPIPEWSRGGHRFQPDSCFVTILLCRDAAASRAGTSCCSLPCPRPAGLTVHSPSFAVRFFSIETRHWKYEIRHPEPRPRSALSLYPLRPCNTLLPHTHHPHPP